MELEIHCNTILNNPQYNDNVKNLMGAPIKIVLTQKAPIHPNLSLRLMRKPYTPSTKITYIDATTHTTKGIISSRFKIISDVTGNICALRSSYNLSDSALLDDIVVDFYTLIKRRKETRIGGPELPDSLYRFHHWLVSEIAENLNNTGHFSSLHDGADIQSFDLDNLPKLRKQRSKAD